MPSLKEILIIFFFVYSNILPSVTAISIGTAPGVMDLGEVKPGQEVYFKFYLVTNSPNDIVVSLSPIPAHMDMYRRNQTTRYTFIPSEASQYDISSWIDILTTPVLVSPSNVKIVYLPDGSVVRANAEVDVKLKVPEDAEPCYYAYGINLSPKLPRGATGVGTMTIGVTRFILVFKVSGAGSRSGEIINIFADRETENRARVDVLFRNTGTCTIQARVDKLELYDKFGNLTKTLRSGYTYVRPNEIKVISSYWTGDVKPGEYKAEISVDYITGSADGEMSVEVPSIVMAEKPEGRPPNMCKPLLTILSITVVMGLVIFFVKPPYWMLLFLLMILLLVTMCIYGLKNCDWKIQPWVLWSIILVIGGIIYFKS